MKKYLISIGVFTTVVFSNVGMGEIDKMVSQIQQPREGIALKELSSGVDPFIAIKKDENITKIVVPQKSEERFTLNGIINRKAYINGKWYVEGDEVSGYILKHVGVKGVVLTDSTHIKRLFLHKKQEGLIMIKEGK
ncbi:MAG: hypothetical protein U9Q90_05705 [Campylobacterota bacterium]|nr:hypothetical protein [Campylobacterota bacterium]